VLLLLHSCKLNVSLLKIKRMYICPPGFCIRVFPSLDHFLIHF
jgi:hypothetical protein